MKKLALSKASFLLFFLFGGVCPLCIPKIMVISSFLGIGFLPHGSPWGKVVLCILFFFVLYMAAKNYAIHKKLHAVSLTILSTSVVLFYALMHPGIVILPIWTLYTAIIGMFVGFILDSFYCKCSKKCSNIACTHASRPKEESTGSSKEA